MTCQLPIDNGGAEGNYVPFNSSCFFTLIKPFKVILLRLFYQLDFLQENAFILTPWEHLGPRDFWLLQRGCSFCNFFEAWPRSSYLKVWTSRQRCAWQRGICKGLQLWPPADPPFSSELHSVKFVWSLLLLKSIVAVVSLCNTKMQNGNFMHVTKSITQAAAMMSESRYAVVVVDSATALYRWRVIMWLIFEAYAVKSQLSSIHINPYQDGLFWERRAFLQANAPCTVPSHSAQVASYNTRCNLIDFCKLDPKKRCIFSLQKELETNYNRLADEFGVAVVITNQVVNCNSLALSLLCILVQQSNNWKPTRWWLRWMEGQCSRYRILVLEYLVANIAPYYVLL